MDFRHRLVAAFCRRVDFNSFSTPILIPRMLPLHVSISQVRTRERRLAELTRQQCFILGAGVQEGMSLEVLVPGEATLADETLEGLEGASSRHFITV